MTANEQRVVRIVFKDPALTSVEYFATVDVVRKMANDFDNAPNGGRTGVYEVFDDEQRPRTLALRFVDVLYIG